MPDCDTRLNTALQILEVRTGFNRIGQDTIICLFVNFSMYNLNNCINKVFKIGCTTKDCRKYQQFTTSVVGCFLDPCIFYSTMVIYDVYYAMIKLSYCL